MSRIRRSDGYTLVEIMVVCIIIGILAAVGIPQYQKTIETGRAQDAATVAAMVGTTNRMYSMDFGGQYAYSGALDNGCNAAACTNVNPAPACNLIACNYLARQDFVNKLYTFQALNGNAGASTSACGLTFPSGTYVGCAARKSGGPEFSSTWGYAVGIDGKLVASNSTGSPTPSPP